MASRHLCAMRHLLKDKEALSTTVTAQPQPTLPVTVLVYVARLHEQQGW
jgi:hypothetical protein